MLVTSMQYPADYGFIIDTLAGDGDTNPNLLNEIKHFFAVYKDLEGHKVGIDGFGERAEALEVIAANMVVASSSPSRSSSSGR